MLTTGAAGRSVLEVVPGYVKGGDDHCVVESAGLSSCVWNDPDWGTLIWVAMTTGARRGELCALRWSHVDLTPGREVLWLYRAISHSKDGWIEGELKTHQQRRVALDPYRSSSTPDTLLQDESLLAQTRRSP